MKWWQWPEELKEEESRNNIAKASEEYRKQLLILENFEKEDKWSGTGESMDVPFEQLSSSYQTELRDGEELNSGRYGAVWKTPFRGVTLARKTIKLSRFKKDELKLALNEGRIVRGLDRHQHIVKIVGTCLQDFDPVNWVNGELHILMFPVAHCDLAAFLDDCEEVSAPSRGSLTELPNRLERLVSLGFHVSKPAGELRHEIQIRLKEIMGCLCDAVEWMHKQDIEHRDLKPANILVRPEQILLTDFGISRNEAGARCTTDYHVGYTLGYAAPEVLQGDWYNAKQCDIYSLGCVFLHILTVVHGPNVSINDSPDTAHPSRDVSREKRFRAHVKNVEKDSLYEEFTRAHQFLPPPLVKLLAGMMDENRRQRPSILEVNSTLRSLSNSQDHYFGSCCLKQNTMDEKKTEPAPCPSSLDETIIKQRVRRTPAILHPGDLLNELALDEPQAEALADEFDREAEIEAAKIFAAELKKKREAARLARNTAASGGQRQPSDKEKSGAGRLIAIEEQKFEEERIAMEARNREELRLFKGAEATRTRNEHDSRLNRQEGVAEQAESVKLLNAEAKAVKQGVRADHPGAQSNHTPRPYSGNTKDRGRNTAGTHSKEPRTLPISPPQFQDQEQSGYDLEAAKEGKGPLKYKNYKETGGEAEPNGWGSSPRPIAVRTEQCVSSSQIPERHAPSRREDNTPYASRDNSSYQSKQAVQNPAYIQKPQLSRRTTTGSVSAQFQAPSHAEPSRIAERDTTRVLFNPRPSVISAHSTPPIDSGGKRPSRENWEDQSRPSRPSMTRNGIGKPRKPLSGQGESPDYVPQPQQIRGPQPQQVYSPDPGTFPTDAIPPYTGRPINIHSKSSHPAHITTQQLSPTSGANQDSQLYANKASYRKPTLPHANPMEQPPARSKPQQPGPIQQALDESKSISLRSPKNTPPKSTIAQPQPRHVRPVILDHLSNKAARTANDENLKADVKIDTSSTPSTKSDPPKPHKKHRKPSLAGDSSDDPLSDTDSDYSMRKKSSKRKPKEQSRSSYRDPKAGGLWTRALFNI